MKQYSFEAVIIKNDTYNSSYIEFPYDVQREFGKKGQVKVRVWFDGFEYRGSLVKMGTTCHIIGLNKQVCEAINKQAGDTVSVVIIEDTEERTVSIPQDLINELDKNPEARTVFEKLSYTHKKEYVEWIISARKQETRNSRIIKCIGLLVKGKK